jgi:hypothetical protein
MVRKRSSAFRRRWADIAVIAASAYALAAGTQMGTMPGPEEEAADERGVR